MLGLLSAMAAIGASPDSLPRVSASSRARRGVLVHSGGTFNAGRNAEKRAARASERKNRTHLVRLYLAGDIPLPPLKRTYSQKTIDMLANRRLRQRGNARG